MAGLGFRGFKYFTEFDVAAERRTDYGYNLSDFESVMPASVNVYYPAVPAVTTTISTTTYDFGQDTLPFNVHIIYPTDETTLNYANNTQVSTTYVYNASGGTYPTLVNYGEADKIVTDVSAGQQTTIKETVYNTGDIYLYNRCKPLLTTVTVQRPGSADYARSTKYTYTSGGQPSTVTADPGTTHENAVSYAYDPMGNMIQETLTSTGWAPVTKKYVYTSDGKFLAQAIDIFSHSEYYTSDKWGNTLTHTNINGLTTSYQYDDFNRLVSSTSPTGIVSTMSYQWATALSSCPLPGLHPSYAVVNAVSGIAGSVASIYDFYGRKIRSVKNAFGGETVYTDANYAINGTLYQSTDPYFSTGTPNVTNYYYDGFNRVTQAVNASMTINTSYTPVITSGILSGMSTVVANATASPVRAKQTTTDGTGKPIIITESGTVLSYSYNSNGKIAQTVSNGQTTNYTYDAFANLLVENAPNKNTTVNTYNARNYPAQTTDALGNTFTFSYDGANRLIAKNGPDGAYAYFYGSTLSTYNKTVLVTSPYLSTQTSYTYDAYSRLSTQQEAISGNLFTTQYSYDNYNRVIQEVYPSGDNIENDYNTYGYFSGIQTAISPGVASPYGIWKKNAANAYGETTDAFLLPYTLPALGGGTMTGQVYEESNTYNDRGFLMSSELVNSSGTSLCNYNYSLDEATGDLMQRSDVNRGATESFGYDNLDRLTSVTQTAPSLTYTTGLTLTNTFNYSLEGNIIKKSDISSDAWIYNKYAVCAITNPTTVIPTFTQTATYTPFGKIKTVTENDKQVVFGYRADNQRGMAQYYTAGALTQTRYYAGGDYEETIDALGNVQQICYIYAEGKLVGMYVRNGGALSIKYVRADYQGSITHVLDNTGAIVEERSYDAWGRMRDPDTWDYSTVPAYAYDRGYTGEELLKDFNIINLNGRLYDPLIGRMFSVDPVIGNAANSQSYNAYSYALNNPLKYTDNSGNDPVLAATMLFGAIMGAGSGYAAGQAAGATGGRMVRYVIGGAVVGAIAGAGGYFGGAAGGAVGGGVGGLIGGAAGGYAGGFISGAATAWNGSSNLKQILQAGNAAGWPGAITGGISGGMQSGIDNIGGEGPLATAEASGNEWAKVSYYYEGATESGSFEGATEIGGDMCNVPRIRTIIALNAMYEEGSTDWNYDVAKDNFPAGKNKCNLFVYDILEESGASPGKPNGYFDSYPPTAGQWADKNYKIPGWVVVDSPEPGDVCAEAHNYRDATGHVAIVVCTGRTVGVVNGSEIDVGSFGFRASNNPTFRRFIGPCQF